MVLPTRLIGKARFGEPGFISPTIRFFRYIALLSGIAYGFSRASFLQNRADRFKTIRDKKKAERLERERLAKIKEQESSWEDFQRDIGVRL